MAGREAADIAADTVVDTAAAVRIEEEKMAVAAALAAVKERQKAVAVEYKVIGFRSLSSL